MELNTIIPKVKFSSKQTKPFQKIFKFFKIDLKNESYMLISQDDA